MKTRHSVLMQAARGVSLCASRGITIAGQTFVPDADTAYVEFQLAHAFPVTIKYRTGMHPQVVANSYRSMVNKVFNLAHIMRKYDKDRNPVDRILGTILAVEFPETPEDGWKVGASRESAPGIRAVAVMHKAAQYVDGIVASWEAGNTPFDPNGEWTVSMENTHDIEESGFVVKGNNGLEKFEEGTPDDLRKLGYVYASCMTCPMELLKCLNNDADDRRDGITSTRVCRDFNGQETFLLLNGLGGTLRFQGVGLCPVGMEEEARVKTMLAAEESFFNCDRVLGVFDEFLKSVRGK